MAERVVVTRLMVVLGFVVSLRDVGTCPLRALIHRGRIGLGKTNLEASNLGLGLTLSEASGL